MAREMALTGRFVPAERALRCGLVNDVHPDKPALLAAAREMATEIAANSPLAVQGTKRVLNYSDEHTTAEGLEYVAQWNSSFLRSHDLMEAVSAFMEKRSASYTGR
jgi:enoyl-CoA hydratase